ncbi:nitroreductase [Companilactobacillus zhachilii]|uniref:Nitroreductase n=1 Tax=Companilactobacillus zhachilii TaxID=2304606 RepID=A0A386PT41_9LACO|nr:nitroreductase [Companilactobacillus zhachilii]AYE39241.1 nitroreductase [Companilactobacillus zhachilii]
MDLIEVVKKRHSVRHFSQKSVATSDIKEIIKLAQLAPSWVNSQPWKVYAATGKTLEQIKADYEQKDHLNEKSHPDFPVMHRDDWNNRTQANMKQWRHEIVHHFADFDEAHHIMSDASEHLNYAPVILFLTMPKDSSLWSVFDMGSFGQTIMLAAKDKGLDTIPNYNSVRFPEVLRKQLDIPEDETIVVGISLGYAEDIKINTYQSKREPLEDVLKISK